MKQDGKFQAGLQIYSYTSPSKCSAILTIAKLLLKQECTPKLGLSAISSENLTDYLGLRETAVSRDFDEGVIADI
jgi:hypothetical protein